MQGMEFSSVKLCAVMKFLFMQKKTKENPQEHAADIELQMLTLRSGVLTLSMEFLRPKMRQDLKGLQRCRLQKLLIVIMT